MTQADEEQIKHFINGNLVHVNGDQARCWMRIAYREVTRIREEIKKLKQPKNMGVHRDEFTE